MRLLLAFLLSLSLATAARAEQRPVANTGEGEALSTAFGKLNANDAELYTSVRTLSTGLAGKAPLVHTHTTSAIVGLDAALAGKAPLAGPTFTGVLTTPALALSGPGSSGPADGFSARPPGATHARTLAEIAGDAPSLESFIPAGTSFAQYAADATSTFQAAAAATCAKSPAGGVVRLPARTLVLPAAVSITWSCAIHWLGAPPSEVAGQSGTWLHVTGTAAPPFAITGLGVRGSTFEHLGVYQDHPAVAPGWAPTAYPPVFAITSTAGTTRFRDILAAPVYDLIRADDSGRLDAADIRGQVFRTAYWIDRSHDASHLHGTQHFWPFWSFTAPVMAWQTANQDLLVLARVDGLVCPDLFQFGGRSTLRLVQSATDDPGGLTGFATKVHVGSLYADSVKWAVWSPKAGGGLPFQYPQVRVDALSAVGADPMTGAAMPDSSALRVDAAGGLDFSAGRLSAESTAAAPVYLGNTAVASRVRVGDFSVSGSYAGPSVYAASGSVGNDVAIASPVSNGLQPLTNKVAMAFSAPLPAGGVVAVASGGSFAMSSAQRGNVFSGAASGYAITLPASPFDGMEVGLTFTGAVSGLSITAPGGAGVTGAPSSVAAGAALRWTWVAGANGWFPR